MIDYSYQNCIINCDEMTKNLIVIHGKMKKLN